MYTVEWNNHIGAVEQLEFETMEDAKLEAAWLADRVDFVEIVKEGGTREQALPMLPPYVAR